MALEDPHLQQAQDPNLPARSAMNFPDALPLLMLPGRVVFPMALVPMQVRENNDVQLIDDTIKSHGMLALVAMRESDGGDTRLSNAYDVGCIGRILQVQYQPTGGVDVVVQTLRRFRISGLVRRDPYNVVRVEPLEDIEGDAEELAAMAQTVKNQMFQMIELSPTIPDSAHLVVENIDNAGYLSDLVAGNLSVGAEEKQKLLRELDQEKRLRALMHLLERELEKLRVSSKIHEDVKSSIDKNQREFYLRQQLKAIQQELGEGGQQELIEEYREKVEALRLPEEVHREVTRELDRLDKMHEASPEYSILTSYLDTMLELPWNETTEDNLDIDHAEKVLNEDHFGLDKVKRRILEYLAVRKLKPDAQGPILCFLGPPGVGKTSLGRSIANAVGRKYVRMSLGGMRDEAEIRGHRKTYVGALPGRIIQNMRKAGANNPVFVLDEIDKIGADFRGDPASALLEVLDPAQNDTFTDHYINAPFDLSRVMFIATANMLDPIPWPLRDRMEIIDIPSYTQEEKLQIARRYLVPRQLDAHGLKKKNLKLGAPALRRIISDYTREAGVRNLEREIGNVCRGVARKIAVDDTQTVNVQPEDLREYLGAERHTYDIAERTKLPGVVTGLAWTPVGGDILFIEATRMPGKGQLILTGQLGEVMKESATAALSYLRSNAQALGIDAKEFSDYDMHVHVPAGAVSKDGPSAGTAMLTAITGLLVGKRVRHTLAMTGEITLRGVVLPVGGIKEKVLAASRAKIREVILPDRNMSDYEEIPERVRGSVKVHFVSRMSEVLDIALGIDAPE